MRFALGLILALLMVEAALAQDTIGDLLAAGGKRLTKDEALAVLRGATIAGPTAAGGESLAELKENGTTSGYLTNATGARGAIFGTWSVDDAGNFCRDIELRFRETRQVKDCFPVYRLGDQLYFPATASSEPSVRVLKRTVSR